MLICVAYVLRVYAPYQYIPLSTSGMEFTGFTNAHEHTGNRLLYYFPKGIHVMDGSSNVQTNGIFRQFTHLLGRQYYCRDGKPIMAGVLRLAW
jgi:hypothetical protein